MVFVADGASGRYVDVSEKIAIRALHARLCRVTNCDSVGLESADFTVAACRRTGCGSLPCDTREARVICSGLIRILPRRAVFAHCRARILDVFARRAVVARVAIGYIFWLVFARAAKCTRCDRVCRCYLADSAREAGYDFGYGVGLILAVCACFALCYCMLRCNSALGARFACLEIFRIVGLWDLVIVPSCWTICAIQFAGALGVFARVASVAGKVIIRAVGWKVERTILTSSAKSFACFCVYRVVRLRCFIIIPSFGAFCAI